MAAAALEFGRFFRNRRTLLGLSLSEFCRQFGFDKGNISRLERGLTPPPASTDLLRSYADALQLDRNSPDWKAFMGHAAIARGKLPSAVSDERAADVAQMLRRLGRRLHDSWVKARDLEQWSPTRDAEQHLPLLVRQLLHATTEGSTRVEVRGGDGVQLHGWDGIVEAPEASLFVPAGISGWEITTNKHPRGEAEKYINNRRGPLGLPPDEVTFVFVTSRKWDRKQDWRDQKRNLGKWRSVEVYDSSDLEAWLELAPAVDAWIAERLGRRPSGVISIGEYWESLSRLREPRLRPELFLVAREKTAEALRAFLQGPPGVMPIQCRSPIEAVDFAAAYLATIRSDDAPFALEEADRIRAQSRTVVVRDRAQWDGLSQTTGPLNLVPIPWLSLSGEDLTAAISRGHRILMAATQFANHRLQPVELPRPSRYQLEQALSQSGFEREAAVTAARAAGGRLSVLKRQIATVPSPQLPAWCSGPGLADFLPMLLVGGWDDANEIDRGVLSQLSGDRPYGELHNAANRLSLAEDAPLTRIESRWRLVSPEDAWTLAGEYVTADLLRSFETIAIDVLSQQEESFNLSADQRLVASIKDELAPIASPLLRRGISETAAILGSGFGPAARLSGARERAERIVRSTLQQATWLKWATLGDVLPLLAEAAPGEFLAAISADLEKARPELAKLLADDDEGHPLMSSCKHAGLLWALEGLAWSPELLPQVCAILAKLDEVDSGRKWSNRPASSLCEILLPWYPQTAAGVEKRIAVLKSLADHTPAVAWKILFAMLPLGQAHADLTHRPIWRDWMSAWREGASGADYWKQVDTAGKLIVQLVANDRSRWSKVLDELQSVPETHRGELIDRLRQLPVDQMDLQERRHLAEQLRKTIQRHRDFADTDWSLPVESVDALEQALPRLLPDGTRERRAWLFALWPKIAGFPGKHREMETQLDRLRADALREILDEEGLEGILKFADMVESPRQVGRTLALSKCVPDERILPALLGSVSASHQSLATMYAGVRINQAGWDWVRAMSLQEWDPGHAAVLLSQAGLVPEAWNFAESLGETVVGEYWKLVPAFGGSHLDQPTLEFACGRLIQAGRPESAIGMLSGVAFDEFTTSPSTVMDALAACHEWKQAHSDSRLCDDTLHVIKRLFGWLQKTSAFNNDEPTRRLGRLEWTYLELLDGFGALPQTLLRCLSDDPEFFARLIALIYRSKDEQQAGTESTEEQQKLASHGYRLLRNWKRIPGTQPDGLINGEQLLKWMQSARTLCRSSGHLEVAESKIGEMLASWPQPKDGDVVWPCEEICDAIEEADSDDLDHGFQIGIWNSRGVTMRSLLDGGDLERKEAAKYRRWAGMCDMDWPRTAASLRSAANSYESDAQREDARAAERAQDRH